MRIESIYYNSETEKFNIKVILMKKTPLRKAERHLFNK